jgi:hypothetical protein
MGTGPDVDIAKEGSGGDADRLVELQEHRLAQPEGCPCLLDDA